MTVVGSVVFLLLYYTTTNKLLAM